MRWHSCRTYADLGPKVKTDLNRGFTTDWSTVAPITIRTLRSDKSHTVKGVSGKAEIEMGLRPSAPAGSGKLHRLCAGDDALAVKEVSAVTSPTRLPVTRTHFSKSTGLTQTQSELNSGPWHEKI